MNVVAIWSSMGYRPVAAVQFAVAALGTLAFGWDLIAHRKAGARDPYGFLRDGLIAALGVAAFLCWWNLGRFNYPDFIQFHEQYHYYIGTKYFPELGYSRLYQCAAVAEVEDGFREQVEKSWIRNLNTNSLQNGEEVVADPTTCTSHFTPERWAAFRRDVAWFRTQRPPDAWRAYQTDYGYNATPVWGIAGRLLANATEASTAQILGIALLDPLLIIVMWGFVWRAFGWRATCVALIWWGTNYPARFMWTGGAFLRADWLACSTIGICLVRRGRPAMGGFALTTAALLRVFPGFIIFGLVLKAFAGMWRRRRPTLEPDHKAFAAGCIVAMALLLPLSAIVVGGSAAGGVDAWSGFIANSRKHLATPLANNIGLKTILSYESDSRLDKLAGFWVVTPWDTWAAARQRVFEERQPIFWALVTCFVVLFARAVSRQEDWTVLALGVGLLPIVTNLTSYYYAALLIFGLLWIRSRWVGTALCAVSAVTCVSRVVWKNDDDVYMAISVLVVGYSIAVLAHFVARGKELEAADLLSSSMLQPHGLTIRSHESSKG